MALVDSRSLSFQIIQYYLVQVTNDYRCIWNHESIIALHLCAIISIMSSNPIIRPYQTTLSSGPIRRSCHLIMSNSSIKRFSPVLSDGFRAQRMHGWMAQGYPDQSNGKLFDQSNDTLFDSRGLSFQIMPHCLCATTKNRSDGSLGWSVI